MTQWAETNWKWFENEHLPINTLMKLFWFFFFFLRHGKVNLRTSANIFYKSTAPANIKSTAFGNVLWKSAFYGRQICSFYGLWQHLRPSNLRYLYCCIFTLHLSCIYIVYFILHDVWSLFWFEIYRLWRMWKSAWKVFLKGLVLLL